MSITSLSFFVFLAITLIIYYIVPKKGQWTVLLAASVFFFGYASKHLMIYMLITTALIYIGGLYVEKLNNEFQSKKKELEKQERKTLKAQIKKKQYHVVAAIVVVCVGVLTVLKYGDFFGEIVNDISNLVSQRSVMPAIKLALPLGISYYTLMLISYIVDVYRGTVEAEKNPLRLLLFVCYFPHITEGPFDTYGKLAPQFNEHHSFDYDKFMNAGSLLLMGLVKKMVLADRVAYIANEVFDHFENYSGIPMLIGMLAYTIQIYFDFSGCIDIVRGVSKMFGIDISDNFNRPFFSQSIQEFWRRWHITLGTWLRNYIFYPVSLSNFSKKLNKNANKESYFSITLPTLLPLFCVWMTMGIWHGASWKYVVYGLYYFAIIVLGLLLEPAFLKFYNVTKIKRDGKWVRVLQILRTDVLIVIGLTMFRAGSLGQFWQMMRSAIGVNLSGIRNIMIQCSDLYKLDYVLIVILVLLFFIKSALEEKGKNINERVINSIYRRWIWITFAIIIILLLGIYGTGYTMQPSVYAEF